MPGPKSKAALTKEQAEAAKLPDPTNCDSCGKKLGVWFSLYDKAYCSPCFNTKFWAPFQSVKPEASSTKGSSVAPLTPARKTS